MFKANLMVGALALVACSGVMAELVYVSSPENKLNYRMVGKVVCYDAKISVDEQPVDASINARLQEVRGNEVQLEVKEIKVSALNVTAPKVLVMDSVSYSRGETVWAQNKGWYVCP